MHRILGVLILAFALVFSKSGFSQYRSIDWRFLAKVTWDDRYFPDYDETVWYPEFSQEVLGADSSLVEIQGYIIPIDVESGFYVLSANPFASCFFCGNAGPESVLELQFTQPLKNIYKTDEIATFRGRLKLNWDDLEHCNYILTNATEK